MKVKVTKTDICRGIPGSAECCPIARAIARNIHKTVEDYKICVMSPNNIKVGSRQFKCPTKREREKVKRFIKRFDYELNVRPITVSLKEVK